MEAVIHLQQDVFIISVCFGGVLGFIGLIFLVNAAIDRGGVDWGWDWVLFLALVSAWIWLPWVFWCVYAVASVCPDPWPPHQTKADTETVYNPNGVPPKAEKEQ